MASMRSAAYLDAVCVRSGLRETKLLEGSDAFEIRDVSPHLPPIIDGVYKCVTSLPVVI